jgi:hypothetical protein
MEPPIGAGEGVNLAVMASQRWAMILDPIILLAGSAAGLVFWLIRRHRKNKREAVLNVAWHEVLHDPHYTERRRIEERRLFVDEPGHHLRG